MNRITNKTLVAAVLILLAAASRIDVPARAFPVSRSQSANLDMLFDATGPHAPGGASQEMAGIEKLHQQDIAATLANDPDKLAELWCEDAVRLEPGPAEIGKALIHTNDARDHAAHPESRMVNYVPDIKDVKIVGGWAFEWGYFSGVFKESPAGEEKKFKGKLLRVMQKQGDGSWKFSRVMWNLAE